MTEAATNDDYWNAFINDTPKQKPKEHPHDLSFLKRIESCVLPPPKKPEVVEKIHPHIQFANKPTKTGMYVQEICKQRARCKNYNEIQEQEQRQKAQKLLQKMVKKSTRKSSRRQNLGGKAVPRSRRAQRGRKSSDSEEQQDSPQQKRARQTGPPYLPHVISMDSLYKKPSKKAEGEKKKQKRHAGSRSRSKLDRKLKAKKKHNGSDPESSPEKSVEPDKSSSAHSNMEVEGEASKKISSPLEKLLKTNEEVSGSNYLFESRSTKMEILQSNLDSALTKNQQDIIFPKRSERLKVDQSNELLSPTDAKPYLKQRQQSSQKNQDEQLAERLRLATKKNEQIKKKLEQQQRKRILLRQLQKIERSNFEGERNLKAYYKEDISKHKTQLDEPKKKPSHHHKNRSKSPSHRSSTRSFNTETNWKDQLRKVTRYNPQDEKYRKRDQRDIQESGFAQMNIEEAHSRKMGKREEQLEEFRYNQKNAKKRLY